MQHTALCGSNAAVTVYLKMSCVSRSICSPLMNRAESPGCSPRVPLKNYGEREKRQHDVTIVSNPTTTHSNAAEAAAAMCSTHHQSWQSHSQLYCKTRGNSQYKAVTRQGDSSKQALTALFRAITPHNKQI